jgi:SAM-dependent methyltransferase
VGAPTNAERAAPFDELEGIIACPISGQRLIATPAGWITASGEHRYPVEDGIPRFFVPTDAPAGADVTRQVQAFYEETPFPNYDDLDSRDSLIEKARASHFAAMLDAQLPDDALVLEAGCGTGQLTNYLGLSWKRRVIGGDMCVNSLRLAKSFRDQFRIANAAFLQMNLFRPPFRDGTFDVIISNGVLHHTKDPRGGFESLVRKLKPGGLIVIGLYNRLGRLPTLWRRRLFERSGSTFHFLDRRLNERRINAAQRRAWHRDQYEHPHESKHSITDVLDWFDTSGVEFLSGVPPVDGSAFTPNYRLFAPHRRGRVSDNFGVELCLLLEGGREGGLFIMIGRKSLKDAA